MSERIELDPVVEFYVRHQGIISQADLTPVTVIGCGTSGTCLGLQLAKLGVPRLVLYDGDSVESHNLSNQIFPRIAVGQKKARVLADIIDWFSPTKLEVEVHEEEYRGQQIDTNIVFSCVDSFEARKRIFKNIVRQNVDWFIDTRMGGEYSEVWTIRVGNRKERAKYVESLSEDPLELPCTARSVIYNGFGLASLASSIFVKILNKEGEMTPLKVGLDLRNYAPIYITPRGV